MTDAEYQAWAQGVLGQIGAPIDSINLRTEALWSQREGGRDHMNPLNTTWFMPGAVPWNTLRDGRHVWTYASVNDAIMATANTLLQLPPDDYPTILDHFRRSIPAEQWQDCCAELGKWGTGCGWLPHPSDPSRTLEDSMIEFDLPAGKRKAIGGPAPGFLSQYNVICADDVATDPATGLASSGVAIVHINTYDYANPGHPIGSVSFQCEGNRPEPDPMAHGPIEQAGDMTTFGPTPGPFTALFINDGPSDVTVVLH